MSGSLHSLTIKDTHSTITTIWYSIQPNVCFRTEWDLLFSFLLNKNQRLLICICYGCVITSVIPAVVSRENVSDVSEVGDAKRKAKNIIQCQMSIPCSEYVLTWSNLVRLV